MNKMPAFGACWLLLLVHHACVAAPPITAAAFAPGGTAVVLGSQAGVEVRSWPDLKHVRKIDTELAHVHDLAFSPDGTAVAAAGGHPADQGAVELTSWPEGKRLRRMAKHKDLVQAVAWSPDGKRIATASADGTCHVLEVESGKLIQTFKGHSRPVLSLCYLPDGKHVVSTGIDQTIRLWNADSGEQVRSLDNHVGPVRGLTVSPLQDNPRPYLASASADRTVRIWQPTIGRLVRFARLPHEPLCIAWAPDAGAILVGCVDGKVRALDPDTVQVIGEEQALPGWVYTIAVSPSGKDILIAGEGGRAVRAVLPLQEGAKNE